MYGSLGLPELILILLIVLIIFGAGKLPQLGEGLGKAIKGFKKSVYEGQAETAEAQAEAPPQARAETQLSSPQPDSPPPSAQQEPPAPAAEASTSQAETAALQSAPHVTQQG